MHSRPMLVPLLLISSLCFGADKHVTKDTDLNPPRLDKVMSETESPTYRLLNEMAGTKPQMPLGPPDVLKGYELGMNLVVQKMSADFDNILHAQQAKEISREQAEFLLQETYQTAMMQFQVLAALHEALAQDMAVAEEQDKPPHTRTNPDSHVVVQLPMPDSSSGCK